MHIYDLSYLHCSNSSSDSNSTVNTLERRNWTHQFPPLLLLRLFVPLLVYVRLESLQEGVGVVRVEQGHQVVDVGRRQAESLILNKHY